MWKASLLLCLFLSSACAAVADSAAGRTKGATCVAQHDILVTYPVTTWGEDYGRTLRGWGRCIIRDRQQFTVVGPGDLDMNTRNIISADGKCSGNMVLAAMDNGTGGISLTETIFPFMRPLPIL